MVLRHAQGLAHHICQRARRSLPAGRPAEFGKFPQNDPHARQFPSHEVKLFPGFVIVFPALEQLHHIAHARERISHLMGYASG
jgi:hypothetical protein